jgi:hypothetical protein
MNPINLQRVQHVENLINERRKYLLVEALRLGSPMPEEIHRDHAKMLRILGNVMNEILQVAAHPMEKHEREAVTYFKDPSAIPALEESCFATEQLYPV